MIETIAGANGAGAAGRGRKIVFALFDGCEIMDLAGPMQAFHEAAQFGHPFDCVVAATTSCVRAAQPITFSDAVALPTIGPRDRVIVPGYVLGASEPSREFLEWLASAYAAGAEICSVCTGAFALGFAGILDGKECTTHWRRVGELAQTFPRARVVGERLFVQDGRIVTSAGISAGVDMALSLLEADGGPWLASSVAREMVVYIRRDAQHSQSSVYLDYQTHLHAGIHLLQQFLSSHPSSRASMSELAAIAGMSERNLSRVFRRATGISLGQYRTRIRIARAHDLRRNPGLTMEAIATACGFTDARQLRRLLRSEAGDH